MLSIMSAIEASWIINVVHTQTGKKDASQTPRSSAQPNLTGVTALLFCLLSKVFFF
jgi:hypothetical protein